MVRVVVHFQPIKNILSIRIYMQAKTMAEAVELVDNTFSDEYVRKRIIRVEYNTEEDA